MKLIKIISIGFLIFIAQIISAQMISTDIQSHLLNKNWSSKPNTDQAVKFNFTDTQLFLYSSGRSLANSFYYITNTDCNTFPSPFDDSKIGSTSSANYIKTKGLCYIIEFYPDLTKFRIRPTNSNEWQDFYLLK